jgi:tyrosyl-tRNA synthetase
MNPIPDNISKHDNVFDVLKERGFIEQTTHDDEIRDLLGKESVRFYIGFDATADSLHVGHFIQIIIMMYMQKYGHTPIVLIGGGTTMVGDPSGRTDMRQLMTPEVIEENGRRFEGLFRRFMEFDEGFSYTASGRTLEKGSISKEPAPGKAIRLNNASWLAPLNYIEFIRDIGRHFSVNNMLRAECFKQRMEKGLSFLEFNYMLMQSYDFMVLARDVDCKMQFGGNDQWSNIISGADLARRELGKQVYGMTFALLTTSEGVKMGKTQKGALWLDADKTSPYEFYQYWRNVEDADVNMCLRMLTFLPMEEVNRLSAFEGEKLNEAKEVLGYEVTRLVHGEDEAEKAQQAARAAFGDGGDMEGVPSTSFAPEAFEGEGMGIVTLMRECGLVKSNTEGFRTIEQGGLSIDGEKVEDPKLQIMADRFRDGALILKKGKKTFHRVQIER